MTNAFLAGAGTLNSLLRSDPVYSTPATMPDATNLDDVKSSGMCIACGACCAADPSISLKLNDARQIYEPASAGGPLAATVCPSIEVDYEELHRFVFGTGATGPLGVIRAVYLAQSTDAERNRKASSGGLIKEAIRYLLSSGIAEGVISIVHKRGLEYEPSIIRSPTDVDTLPGSIYHNINLQSAISLIEQHDARLALVAIPCQLEGVYNYIAKIRPELRKRIVFTIGLLCAWQYTRHSIRAIATYSGLEHREITDVAFRGGDMIGKLRLQLGPRREVRIDRRASLNYQVAFDRYFNTPRCFVCINHTNFFADLVVGDSWMQSTRFTKTGVSIAVARSANGLRAIQEMQERGQIVSHEIGEKELLESEGESLVYGEFAYAFSALLRKLGEHAPHLQGPNQGCGRVSPQTAVIKFYDELMLRRKLMMQGRYRALWWRKMFLEGHKITRRYLTWFISRALRLKAITGRDRDLSREELKAKFR